MAIWKTYRIADIISEISDEKFVLPVIQRPLVWTEDKMELLFDTLLKGDSVGFPFLVQFKSRIFSCYTQSYWA